MSFSLSPANPAGWSRSLLWIVVPFVAGLLALPAIQHARAQDGEATLDEVFDEDDEDAQIQPADPPAAANANGGAGNEAAATESSKSGTSYLKWAWRSLGVGYSLVFLTLSFVLVALFVMSLLTARREDVVPVALVEEFETHIGENRFQEAYDLAKNDESMLGQVLAAGMSKLKVGYPQAIEAMQEVGEEENMKLEHRLSYMALIGTISPMIGLLGTVQGIIGAFQVIADTATGAPDAQALAKELSTALFTTLVGLFIAIPAIAAYNILRNRVARLVLEVGIVSEGLMSRFQNMNPKKN